jgi:hypothetical protein
VERIGVKSRTGRNLYVLIVRAAGKRKSIQRRIVTRRSWGAIEPGIVLSIGRLRVRVMRLTAMVSSGGGQRLIIEARRVRMPANVVAMPRGDSSVVADFLRYHVLISVYDGDVDAWLRDLARRTDAEGDVRFARAIRARMRHDPAVMAAIRRLVDATPLEGRLTG